VDIQIASIAEQATDLLAMVAPYLGAAASQAVRSLGEEVGEEVAETLIAKGRVLWDKITQKIKKDGSEQETAKLLAFRDDPEAKRTAVQELLVKYLKKDFDLAQDVSRLLSDLNERTPKSVMTQIKQIGGDRAIQVGSISGGTVSITQGESEEETRY
jgi:hypothetical protein